ncbi:hypothetical protein ACI8AC_10220 [Geodermatophilus sp. SYSU D00758]
MRRSPPPEDPALAALEDICATAQQMIANAQQILQRSAYIRDGRAAGLPYREIVPTEPRPLIVELLSATLSDLTDAGSRWRRAEARALHDEGLSMDAIAGLFGVTRQRVSALLNAPRDR